MGGAKGERGSEDGGRIKEGQEGCLGETRGRASMLRGRRREWWSEKLWVKRKQNIFLLKKVQGLRVRRQPKKERRVSATHGNSRADFVGQEDNRETLRVPYRLFQRRWLASLLWRAFHGVLKHCGSRLARQGQAEEGVQEQITTFNDAFFQDLHEFTGWSRCS
jgi:hypothetical protein